MLCIRPLSISIFCPCHPIQADPRHAGAYFLSLPHRLLARSIFMHGLDDRNYRAGGNGASNSSGSPRDVVGIARSIDHRAVCRVLLAWEHRVSFGSAESIGGGEFLERHQTPGLFLFALP